MVAVTVPQTLEGFDIQTFTVETQIGCTVSGVHRGLFIEEGNTTEYSDGPILVMIHGFPQTWFMWRHVIKLLPPAIRLYVPDIPGYGYSSPCEAGHDKATVGNAILDGLTHLLRTSNFAQPQPIILIGHDRGARICHRLTVDEAEYAPSLTIVGTVLLDIVPTLTQWQAMADPAEATRYFHWPFLANVEIATQMISELGGDNFVLQQIERSRGTNERCRQRLAVDDALEMYQRPFRWDSVVRCACLDYEAGATVDVQMQMRDQADGRKMEKPVLVIHSAGFGRRFDMKSVWKDWIAEGSESLLTVVEMGNGVGHYLAEEDPEGTTTAIRDWIIQTTISVGQQYLT